MTTEGDLVVQARTAPIRVASPLATVDAQGSRQAVSPLQEAAQGELQKLIADGFQLLYDLTGDARMSFEGSYQPWFSRALPAVQRLAPGRADEFGQMYVEPKRRRIDLETYAIQDYILGFSLHGGFGALDAMRAIVARRFHHQLLILKSIQATLGLQLQRLEMESVAAIGSELFEMARTALKDDDPAGALKMGQAMFVVQLRQLARRRNLTRADCKRKPAELLRILIEKDALDRPTARLMADILTRGATLERVDDREAVAGWLADVELAVATLC